jgi:UDP-N-acetylglucosamine 2-epimerase (non-hydrolysing)
MEAGNRCYDDRVPEEVNRRVIDHSSSVLMPYTNRSRENLLAEGFPGNRVYVTGNPIKQVIDKFSEKSLRAPLWNNWVWNAASSSW